MTDIQRKVWPSPEQLVEDAAERLVELSTEGIRQRDRFIIALAGGSTPKTLYQKLAEVPWRERVDWEKVFILFGDERAVPPNDDRSNYQMARETLLRHIDIPPQNVLRMRGEAENLDEAAQEYSMRLEALNAPLDLALLGMGDDGHTASLFPNTAALKETSRLCVATDIAPLEPHVRRLTLTYPVFNAAREVWIIVTGESKAERLVRVLQGARDVQNQPVQGIAPKDGILRWMLDETAAERLG